MGHKYNQLRLEERCKISILQEEGRSIREIAAALARSASTITRELKRNRTKTIGYEPSYAQVQTAGRRWRGSRLERDFELRKIVLDKLERNWSPEQVSANLKKQKDLRCISSESIYRFIYGQMSRTKDYAWRNYLPRRKWKRGRRAQKGLSPVLSIKNRVSIDKRASYIEKRKQIGHWEADLMLFSSTGQAILALHERSTRLTLLFKQKSKHAKPIAEKITSFFRLLPPHMARTVTFDNGTEFSYHYFLHKLGIKTYFCDVRSPWQKGGVENAIGRFRRPLPRKTDISSISQSKINNLVALYNHTPRKCLDFNTPADIFYKQLLHFECESTSLPPQE